MSKICLTVTESCINDALELINSSRTDIDMVELRVDYLTPEDQMNLDQFNVDLPVILTFRKEVDGGLYTGDDDYRLSCLLKAVLTKNFNYVDLEEDLYAPGLENAAIEMDMKIIRSFHDFKGLPKNLAHKLQDIKRHETEIPKAAVMINSTAELLEFYIEVMKLPAEEKIVLGMGAMGFSTRILAEKIGSLLTFCSKEGVEAAPGHVSPKLLNETYRFREITDEWSLMGIIGNPVMHTKSPVIHNAGYRKLGLDAVYVPFETDDPTKFLELAALLNMKGFSVTVPFKNDIIPLMDGLTESVRSIGACNTVTRIDGKWIGENSDYTGFIKPLLKEYGSLEGKNVTLIGAGGAAKACLYALKEEGAKVLVVNRTVEKAKDLAIQFDTEFVGLNKENIDKIAQYSDVIVQTTNVGMHPLEHINPLEFFPLTGKEYLYDIIYTPEVTCFLQAGVDKGCKTLNGWPMLLEQGYRQFRLFTGMDYPLED